MVIQMTNDPGILNELPREHVANIERQAQQMPVVKTLGAIKRFSAAIQDLKGGYQPQLPLELALIETIQGAVAMTASVAQAPIQVQAPIAQTPPVQAQQAQTQQVQPQVQVVAQPSPAPVTTAEPTPVEAPSETSSDNSPQAPAPVPLDAESIRMLRQRWKEFVSAVKQRSGIQVPAALNAVKDIAASEKTVAFAFGQHEFSYDMISRPETKGQVAATLSEFLGRTVVLECQLGDEAQLSDRLGVATEENISDELDPLVVYAVENLGAEVVQG